MTLLARADGLIVCVEPNAAQPFVIGRVGAPRSDLLKICDQHLHMMHAARRPTAVDALLDARSAIVAGEVDRELLAQLDTIPDGC